MIEREKWAWQDHSEYCFRLSCSNMRSRVIIVLLLMIASLVLVFLGLATSITTRMQGSSPFVNMVLTYAGLLVTLLSHIVAFYVYRWPAQSAHGRAA